jgi:hypothetical protein
MTGIETDDFLDTDAYAAPAADPTTEARPRRVPPAAATAGWLVAGLVAGGVAMAAWHSHSSAPTAAGVPAAAAGQRPAAGPGGFPGGGIAGERRLTGTLSAVDGRSFRLTTAGGTTTYTIDASTRLVKDGRPVSSLAALGEGDTVVVRVYPSNGTTRVELVLDGAPGGAGRGPGRPPV